MKTTPKKIAAQAPRPKQGPTPPAHLPGSPATYEMRRGVTRRLHNRRVSVISTPDGGYQVQTVIVLPPGAADEMRRQGHQDTIGDYLLRDRVRYSAVTLSAEAFEAMVWCWEKMKARQQRKR